MAEPYKHIYKVDLNQQLVRRDVGLLATFDSKANRFGAELYRDGASVSASGYTVNGYFIRPNEETVPIPGTVQGNLVYVDLLPGCYLYDGAFEFALKIKQGDVEQTVLMCYGTVERSRTDATASGGDVLVTVTNAEMLGGKPPEAYSAVNLVINGYFRNPVNQRGGALYTGDGNKPVYGIDRWYTWGVGATLTVNNDSITIAGSPFMQNIPIDCFESGKTYTYAIKEKNGTLRIANVQYGSNAGGTAYKIYLEWVGSSGIGYRIYLYEGEFEWAALYEGVYTAETLPPFVPPDPTIEFAKCRMCFREYDTGLDLTSYANGYLSGIPFDMPMRVAPTITECVVVDARLAQYLDVNIRTSATSKNGVMYINVPDAIYQSIYRVERLVLAADL